MAGKQEALGLELRNIIETDQEAAAIIHEAREKRRAIEAATEKEKADILADAAKRRAEAEAAVRAEQEAEYTARQAAARAEYEASRTRIARAFDDCCDDWMDEILARITAG